MSVITTLTLNPSLDRTFSIDRLTRGDVIRIRESTIEAAGKGVNVARALNSNGCDAVAVLPIGGASGVEMTDLLEGAGPRYHPVAIGQPIRSNVTVVESDGTVTKLNEAGPTLSEREREALIVATLGLSSDGEWIAACGSLPPGTPPTVYADLTRRARQRGASIAVDTSGPGLLAVIDASPTLIKPNLHELREITRRPIETLGDAVTAATDLHVRGIGQVLVSLGSDGAVLVTGDSVLHGVVEISTVANTVGAGDTLLAGYLAGGTEPHDALATALAWARAAIRSPLTTMLPLEDADRAAVRITDVIDSARRLESA